MPLPPTRGGSQARAEEPFSAFFAVVLAGLVLTFAACRPASRDDGQTEWHGRTMGTTYTVKLVPRVRGVSEAESIHEAVRGELDAVDASMSIYRDDSELSRFNASSSTDWFEVSPETAHVVCEAIEIGRLSGGALDVTVEPLVRLWNFGRGASESERVPSDAQIEEARRSAGLHLVEARLDPPAIRKDRPEVHVDLSSIAKGHAVDRVADLLEQRGHDNYMVEVGGEVRARGLNRLGRPWQIAIERPIGGTREVQSVLALGTRAMATSGDYRNYFERDGRRYSHLIDPRTGRPIEHRLVSATVLADRCSRADGLATAMIVLGPEAALEWAQRDGIPVLLLVREEDRFVERRSTLFPSPSAD